MKWILLKIILRGCAVWDVLFSDRFILTIYDDKTGRKKAETKYSKGDFISAKTKFKMEKFKCITFDPKAQNSIPEHIKAKMKADRDKAMAIASIQNCSCCGKKPTFLPDTRGFVLKCEPCHKQHEGTGAWFQTFDWQTLDGAVEEWNEAVKCNNSVK